MTIKELANENFLVKKYAQAYINVFFNELTIEDYQSITHAAYSLRRNKKLIFFWKLSAIDPVIKGLSIEQIYKKYKLPFSIKKLAHFLLEQHRLCLIPLVLHAIALLYEKKSEIELFTITSSHELPQSALEIIKQFLACQLKKNIIYCHKIDKNLIAGIRLQSSNTLWESSIYKQLQEVRQLLIR